MLYSLKGAYPAELPNRIRLSDGSTRTDVDNFTEKMIADAGYVTVSNPPSVAITQTCTWNGSDWVVEEAPEWKMQQLKEAYLSSVKEEQHAILLIYYRIKIEELEKNGENLKYNMDELTAYIKKIEAIQDTYNEDTMSVSWPQKPNKIGSDGSE